MAGQEETIHTHSAAYRCTHLVCKSQCVAQHLGACCCAVGVRVATVELHAFLTYLIRPYKIVESDIPTRMNGCAQILRLSYDEWVCACVPYL